MRVLKNTSLLMIFIAAFVTVSMITGPIADAKASSITIKNTTIPAHQYHGRPFSVRGTVKSKYKLTYVRCGVKNEKGQWINKMNIIVNPKKRSFNLKKIDARLRFASLKAGKYRYSIEARSTKEKRKILVNKRFTVSRIYGKRITRPSSRHIKGTSFTMNGKVKSKFRLKKVHVGITTKSGKWINGYNKVKTFRLKRSSARTFDIAEVDPFVKFGRLSAGTYRYKIYAVDEYGQEKYVVNKKFRVGRTTANSRSVKYAASGSIRKGGYRLSYNYSTISSIGRQPVSGPCGQYAMAYARTVLDGSFPLKKKYNSYYKQLYNEYGFKSHYAYWYMAGGSPVWYQTCKNCYKAALKEITNGRPCIINLHNKSTGNNHFVTVIGYMAGTTYDNVSLKSFIALDPGYGTQVFLKNMNYKNSDNPEAVFF